MVRGPAGERQLSARDARLSKEDGALIAAAADLLRRRYLHGRHTVGAAVRTATGRVFTGVNLDGIHSPCAEPVAVGAAISAGDSELTAMVAVCRRGRSFPLLSPCGTCRQMLLDYAPAAYAIVPGPSGRPRRLAATSALPYPFRSFGP